jgi:hypothetical protein
MARALGVSNTCASDDVSSIPNTESLSFNSIFSFRFSLCSKKTSIISINHIFYYKIQEIKSHSLRFSLLIEIT